MFPMLLLNMFQKARLFILGQKKTAIFILILFASSYISYDYGHSKGYSDGYFDGSIDGYITNKYIAHDYANFSADDAVKETDLLKSMRGMNLSEMDKVLKNI